MSFLWPLFSFNSDDFISPFSIKDAFSLLAYIVLGIANQAEKNVFYLGTSLCL